MAGRQKQIHQMDLLLRVAKDVAAQDTLDEMLRSIVEAGTQQTGAESGTLFLNDERTSELYSRIAEGGTIREIRMMNSTGIAGHTFTTGVGAIVDDPYSDPRFNPEVDKQTGYVTTSLICAPIRTGKGEVIGVMQVLNKKQGSFTQEDMRLLEETTSLCAMAPARAAVPGGPHASGARTGTEVPRPGCRRHLRPRSRNHADQSGGRSREDAASRPGDAVPERRKDQ